MECEGDEHHYTMDKFPDNLKDKIKNLKGAYPYMEKNLAKTGENIVTRDGDEMTRLPVLIQWLRAKKTTDGIPNSKAIVMHLNIGTVQVKIFTS